MRKIGFLFQVVVLILLGSSVLRSCFAQPGVGEGFLEPNTPTANWEEEEPDCAKNDENSSNRDDGSVHPMEFFGIFSKLGTNWRSFLKLLLKAVGSAGGTTHRKDMYVDTMEEAVVSLKEMIESAKEKGSASQWSFQTVPFDEFEQSLDDLLVVFLNWAATDGAPDDQTKCSREGGVNGRHETINVSKAFRRLENYAEWMDHGDLMDPPLTANSLEEIWKAFEMQITYDDCNRLVWWLDLSKVDFDKLKAMPPKEVHRLFVWISHYMLFSPQAQENGMVVCNSLANIHFWPFMTMLPLELGMKLNELVISVIPLKTKFVLLMKRPPWAKFGFQLVKPFLKREMQRRVVVIEDGIQPRSFVNDVVGGKSAIPAGFDGLAGTENVDVVESYFYSKTKTKPRR
jgi:hypothetical protein